MLDCTLFWNVTDAAGTGVLLPEEEDGEVEDVDEEEEADEDEEDDWELSGYEDRRVKAGVRVAFCNGIVINDIGAKFDDNDCNCDLSFSLLLSLDAAIILLQMKSVRILFDSSC